MSKVVCPHCSQAFNLNESDHDNLLRQVRDEAFERQLQERLAIAEQQKESAVAHCY